MASLQDQLLKAGLTTKQKTRQANADKRKKNKQKRSGVQHQDSLQEQVKQELINKKGDKLAKDNALNQDIKQAQTNKEKTLRIKQILEHHQLKNVKGEVEYNFTFESKIKKLPLDEKTHRALVNGVLAICGWQDLSYIVTRETAEKLAQLDQKVVLVQNDKTKASEDQVDDSDPYADYQIPDDLMW